MRSASPDQALPPPSGKIPGGAALTGATELCDRVARIRRSRRHPGKSPVALRWPGRRNRVRWRLVAGQALIHISLTSMNSSLLLAQPIIS
ncbi:hypothetical protein CWM52_04130 [Raoultella sp. T31]|nr:hypothetical protein CWM52_04130 [Raoultella sp. T31]